MHNLKQQNRGQISELGISFSTVNASLTCPDGWATVRWIHLLLPWVLLLLWDLYLKKMLLYFDTCSHRQSDVAYLSQDAAFTYILPLYTVPFWGCFSGLVASFWSVFLSLPSLPIAFTGKKENYKKSQLPFKSFLCGSHLSEDWFILYFCFFLLFCIKLCSVCGSFGQMFKPLNAT